MKVFLILCAMVISQQSSAGFLRDKLKERWVEKQKEKPAPEASAATDTKIEKPGDFTFGFDSQGKTRLYKLHVPPSYDAKKSTALIVALHGGGGNMSYQADDKFYKLISKSDQAGFVVAFPNGVSPFKSGELATWNAGKCCGAARDESSDDVGFLKEVVAKISKQLSIDSKKVFAIGMSNGGMMSYRLACEASEVFKAIASVAGTDNTVTCTPKHSISVLHIHAEDDDHVLFQGGAGKNAFRDASKVTDFVSVPATIAKWQKLEACEEKPKRVLEKSGAYCDLYEKCKDKTAVQLCVTKTGGHSWPDGKKVRGVGGEPSTAISANDVIWDFFLKVP